ncbi:MAG TPA: hypothetical protein VJ508_03445, partial [Saprospiraceae bacterium]|nr:hypothetical protein [Saprospiraceae bacterium]
FNMEGGSWTNNLSWVKGYESVLAPMDKASSDFFKQVLSRNNLDTSTKGSDTQVRLVKSLHFNELHFGLQTSPLT